MILGHWYLVVLDLPIVALRRLTVLLAAGLAARAVVVGGRAVRGAAGAFDAAAAVAAGRWSPDGVFVWMRLLFGIAGPLSLIGFVWKTVEIRSTQSATGILYVQLFLVMSGELLATYLRVVGGLPAVSRGARDRVRLLRRARRRSWRRPDEPATCAACGDGHDARRAGRAARRRGRSRRCPACGGRQLYVQRDFNQKVGLAVVIVGAALAPFTPFYSSLFVAAARRRRALRDAPRDHGLLPLPRALPRLRAEPARTRPSTCTSPSSTRSTSDRCLSCRTSSM